MKVDDNEYSQESEGSSLPLKGGTDNSAGNFLNESGGNVIDDDSEASGSRNVGKKEAKYPPLLSLNRFLEQAGYPGLEKHLETEYKGKSTRYKGTVLDMTLNDALMPLSVLCIVHSKNTAD